jgi:hypothetical protein
MKKLVRMFERLLTQAIIMAGVTNVRNDYRIKQHYLTGRLRGYRNQQILMVRWNTPRELIRLWRLNSWGTITENEMKQEKCACGNILSQKEIDFNNKVSNDHGTPVSDMCEKCWSEYANHAVTGEWNE